MTGGLVDKKSKIPVLLDGRDSFSKKGQANKLTTDFF